jgi:DNA-binding MarR family transcriptional regulator
MKSLAKQAVELDRIIHEPARLALMALLYSADEADFLFLLRESGLTKGNMQSHLARLEESDYVAIEKSFVSKIQHTVCRLTPLGRLAFKRYRKELKRLAAQLS